MLETIRFTLWLRDENSVGRSDDINIVETIGHVCFTLNEKKIFSKYYFRFRPKWIRNFWSAINNSINFHTKQPWPSTNVPESNIVLTSSAIMNLIFLQNIFNNRRCFDASGLGSRCQQTVGVDSNSRKYASDLHRRCRLRGSKPTSSNTTMH